jgi:hypothetical protein
VILQSLISLITDSSHVKFDLSLALFPLHDLLPRNKLVSPEASIGYVQTNSNNVAQALARLMSPLISRVCHRSGHDLFLCGHKSIVACASQLRLVVTHVAF